MLGTLPPGGRARSGGRAVETTTVLGRLPPGGRARSGGRACRDHNGAREAATRSRLRVLSRPNGAGGLSSRAGLGCWGGADDLAGSGGARRGVCDVGRGDDPAPDPRPARTRPADPGDLLGRQLAGPVRCTGRAPAGPAPGPAPAAVGAERARPRPGVRQRRRRDPRRHHGRPRGAGSRVRPRLRAHDAHRRRHEAQRRRRGAAAGHHRARPPRRRRRRSPCVAGATRRPATRRRSRTTTTSATTSTGSCWGSR